MPKKLNAHTTEEEKTERTETDTDGEVEQVISDTKHGLAEATESHAPETVLPESVRFEVEGLFDDLRRSSNGKEHWTKSDADRKNIVKLVGLFLEYNNLAPEIASQTGNKVNASMARNYLKYCRSLSDEEEIVLRMLVGESALRKLALSRAVDEAPIHISNTREEDAPMIVVAPDRNNRRIDPDQKRYITAAIRLLRKRTLRTNEARQYLTSIGIPIPTAFNLWPKNMPTMKDPRNIPTTQELIPEVFQKAGLQLGKTSSDALHAITESPNRGVNISEGKTTHASDPILTEAHNQIAMIIQTIQHTSDPEDRAALRHALYLNTAIVTQRMGDAFASSCKQMMLASVPAPNEPPSTTIVPSGNGALPEESAITIMIGKGQTRIGIAKGLQGIAVAVGDKPPTVVQHTDE